MTGAGHFTVTDLFGVAILVVLSAVLEELIFRGVIWQGLERGVGTWWALAITSVFFGVAHLANPGATAFGALAIAVEAGFFLGACFAWRRSLWLMIGIHAGWNATESLLGIPVSGEAPHGLITVHATDGVLLNGGAFGIEASITPMVIGAMLGGACLVLRMRAVRSTASAAVGCPPRTQGRSRNRPTFGRG